MVKHKPRSIVKPFMWLMLVCALPLFILAAWGVRSQQQPTPRNILEGRWIVTDLRGPPDGNPKPYEISIARDGTFDNHDGFIIRFRLYGSRMKVHSWLKEPSRPAEGILSEVSHILLMPFQAHRNDFDLEAHISEDRNEILLAFPGESAFKTLKRIEVK